MREIWQFLKEVFSEFVEDRCPRMAAALSYYAVFSLPPLLVIVVWMASIPLGTEAAQQQVESELAELIGPVGAEQIRNMIAEAQSGPGGGVLGTVLGLVALAFGATAAFAQLQDALNEAWGVRPERGSVRNFLWKRVLSFLVILVVAVLLLASLFLNTVVNFLGENVEGLLPSGITGPFILVLNEIVSLLVFVLLFGLIYRFVPDAEIEWRDVGIGALITALLFSGGKFLIGFYLGQRDVGSAYGAAGFLAAFLLWVFAASLTFFLGAEITQVWARRYGSRIQPSSGAYRLGEEACDETAATGGDRPDDPPEPAGG